MGLLWIGNCDRRPLPCGDLEFKGVVRQKKTDGGAAHVTRRPSGRLRPLCALVLALSPLVGCGGGGGGDGRNAFAGLQRNFTTEFHANGGLEEIGAAPAYEAGFTGKGTKVAVISGGAVDSTHPDLSGQVAESFDVNGGTVSRKFFGKGDGLTAATQQAGLIAAKRNGYFIHGVAYDSRLIAIRDSISTSPASSIRLAAGLDPAFPKTEADIVYLPNVHANRTLGDTGTDGALMNALIAASEADKVVVVPSGFGGESYDRLSGDSFPMAPALNGQVLVVGSVSQSLQLSSFSNPAGGAASIYAVAPGEGITSTLHRGTQICFLGACFPLEPESFTSPVSPRPETPAAFAAGAAAVVKQAFPHLTADQIVQILLQSATDLGEPGIDSVYGHGLINLGRAVQPIGTLSLPTVPASTAGGTSLSSSSLSLSPAFGDALSGSAYLARAAAFDAFGRGYRAGLDRRTTRPATALDLDKIVSEAPTAGLDFEIEDRAQLHLAASEEFSVDGVQAAGDGLSNRSRRIEHASFDMPLAGFASATASFNTPAASLMSTHSSVFSGEPQFITGAGRSLSHLALLNEPDGALLSFDLDERTNASVGWFVEDALEGSSSAVQLLAERTFDGGHAFGLGVGMLDERGTFLGSRGTGALGVDGAQSVVLSAYGRVRLTSDLSVFGTIERIRTDVSGSEKSLLSDWGTLYATALGAGLTLARPFGEYDLLSIGISQPLRVDDAEASLDVPVARDADGDVLWDGDRIDVSPNGREISLDVAYVTPLLQNGTLSANAYLRNEPGHEAGADADIGALLTVAFPF